MIKKVIKYIYIFFVVMFITTIYPVSAAILTQTTTPNECEKLAKEYQNKHGGELIFIQPLTSSGAYDLGEYNGHWMNKAYSEEIGQYYYDPQSETLFPNDIKVVQRDFENIWNKKVQVFNYNQEGLPFPVIWHY